MTLRQAYYQAKDTLQPYTQQGAMITAALCIMYMLLWLSGAVIQRTVREYGYILPSAGRLRLSDLLLPLLLIVATIFLTVFRNRTDRWIGSVTGVLTECDLGFLDCSSRFWLFRRRMAVTLLANTLLILAFVPSILLLSAGMLTLHHAAAASDGTLHLILLLHLLTGSVLLTLLPLRVWCGMAALPLCYLKQPHRSPFTVWKYALRCTRGICGKLLRNRLLCMLSILLPVCWFTAYPRLMATEMLLCDRNRQKILPDL